MEAKFRRDLVLKNLYQNGFINNDQYLELKNKKIKIKRRKIEIVNEANSYTEEVRRIIKDKYGFEKLYTQGLSIKSPLEINFQIEAIRALRKGIEDYDKRHGWRGPITNKMQDVKWREKLDNYIIDPTLKWEKAEVTNLSENYLDLKLEKNKK